MNEPHYLTLKHALTRHGFTQQEAAIECRVSEEVINNVVNGRKPITARLAVRLGKMVESPEYWWKLQCDADLATAYAEERNGLVMGYNK